MTSSAVRSPSVAASSRWGAMRHDGTAADSGAVYLFDASTGAQLFKLLPDGAADDLFGASVAVDGGIVAVGARLDDDNGDNAGAVYLFDASTGAQLFKLFPDDGSEVVSFGITVAIGGGVVAVGSPFDGDNGPLSGSAYLFDAATGAQTAKILPIDGAPQTAFGGDIDIDAGILAVSRPLSSENGDQSGSAYLFDVSTAVQTAKLLPSDGAAGDSFGGSIAIDDGVVVVGAMDDDFGTGSAYQFGDIPPCIADLNLDGRLDFFDIQAFLNDFAAGDEAADFVDDGVFDFNDVQAFLDAFDAGCP